MSLTRSLRRMTLPLGLVLSAACTSSPPPGRVYVVDRPPPFRREIVPVAPGPRYVWIPGRWARAGSGWAWTSGRYIVPPGRYRGWVPGAWHQGRRGWYYVKGHWR
jgi:hypothetical protein